MADQATTALLTDLLVKQQKQSEAQQKLIERFTALLENQDRGKSDEFRMESLGNAITEFVYDPENNQTFDAWYCRYKSLFEEDAKNISDGAKVRLLLRKISSTCHLKYTNILPEKSNELNFEGTIKKLHEMFEQKLTLIHTRYNCLQLSKKSGEDTVTYASRVNRTCEDFRVNAITLDEFKSLIFVCGLNSPEDNDVRAKLLALLHTKKGTTIQELLTECDCIRNLKAHTAMIMQEASNVCSVKKSGQTQDNLKQNSSKSTNKPSGKVPNSACWFCGELHYSKYCKFKKNKCSKCNQVGHKDGYCEKNRPSSNVKQVSSTIPGNRKFVTAQINGVDVQLQVDTASDLTIISEALWKRIGSPILSKSDHRAKDASGSALSLTARFDCNISIKGYSASGSCYTTPIEDLNLLGTDFITKFGCWDVPLSSVCYQISGTPSEQTLAEKVKMTHSAVFNNSHGLCTKAEAQLQLVAQVKPVFRPKRTVAYDYLPLVDQELERLENLGIITPTDNSSWAAPLVVTKKANGSIRICGDYSTGLNAALEHNKYPLPTADGIFATLANNTIFSIIDLSDAFLQVPMETTSRELLTINTHRGLFKYNRLPFGIKVAPSIFQQIMDTMLSGLPGVMAYIDDILVTGKTAAEHEDNLMATLSRVREFGFQLRFDKCQLGAKQIEYLGHIIDQQGLRPNPKRTEAIVNMPPPHDVTSLRSFLGSITYYSKFVPDMHKIRKPLDKLLKKDAIWEWTSQCETAFSKFKEILQSPLLLTHYGSSQEIIVAADASSTGIGACISHKFKDGSIKAIYHASRSLTDTERKYSQIEKEGLALVYATTKFHRMIFGRPFLLETDHKPLLQIFGSSKGIPTHTANRIQRWALILKAYDFKIKYVNTKDFGNADMLSRLINNFATPDEDIIVAMVQIEDEVKAIAQGNISSLPITFKMAQASTAKDDLLQEVIKHINTGWKDKAHPKSTKVL